MKIRVEDVVADHEHETVVDVLLKRLHATADYDVVLETDATFLALPTPSTDDGSIDTSIIKAGARSLGEALATKGGSHLVVVKSTVVPGMNEDVLAPIIATAKEKSYKPTLLEAAVEVNDKQPNGCWTS